MNKLLLASSAVLAFGAAAPALAADGNIVDGFGSFSAGYNELNPGSSTNGGCAGTSCGSNTSTNGETASGLDLNARVTVAVPLGGAFGAQADGEYSRTVYHVSGNGSVKLNDSTFAAHVFLRDPSKGLVGVVAQRTSTNGNFGDGFATYYLGGEAQAFVGRATVYGQLTYGSDDATVTDSNGINAKVELRYFPQDNLKLALRGGYEFFKITPDARYNYCWADACSDKANTVSIGANAEYRLAGSRVSVLGDVDYRAIKLKSRVDYGAGDYEFSRQTAGDLRLMVGVKLNFGAGSLFERDRSGASLDPVRSLGQHAAAFGDGYGDGSGGE
jgi:hypothetical protein